MRRSDYDVTDSIRTTDPPAVGAEVIRLCQALYGNDPVPELERAFRDAAALYRGPASRATSAATPAYHDIQHVLDVTLAMARLMDGYQRSRRAKAKPAAAGNLHRRRRHRPVSRFRLPAPARRQPQAPLRRRVHPDPRIARRGLPAPLCARARHRPPAPGLRPAGALHRLRASGRDHPRQRPAAAPRRPDAGHRGHPRPDVRPLLPREMPRPPVSASSCSARLRRAPCAGKRTLPSFSSGEDLVRKTPGFYRGRMEAPGTSSLRGPTSTWRAISAARTPTSRKCRRTCAMPKRSRRSRAWPTCCAASRRAPWRRGRPYPDDLATP